MRLVTLPHKKLDVLQEHMNEMRARCDEAQAELFKTSDSCRVLLEKASGLRAQRCCSYGIRREPSLIAFACRHTTAARQNIITVFLGRFTLTEAEAESITSHDVPVGKQLFAAMDRAEKIRANCQMLLSGEDGAGTKAG